MIYYQKRVKFKKAEASNHKGWFSRDAALISLLFFLFKDNDNYVCDGYQQGMVTLHTQSYCESDDRRRYFLIFDSSTGTYLFKAKGTDRYVRIDEDKFVTTIHNLADDRARFKILP